MVLPPRLYYLLMLTFQTSTMRDNEDEIHFISSDDDDLSAKAAAETEDPAAELGQ